MRGYHFHHPSVLQHCNVCVRHDQYDSHIRNNCQVLIDKGLIKRIKFNNNYFANRNANAVETIFDNLS